MNPKHDLLKLLVLGIPFLFTGSANAQIEWRVSVKFVLGPNGERPGSLSDPNCTLLGCSAVSCEQEVQEKIDYGNTVLAELGRGYRMRLLQPVDIQLPAPDYSCCEDSDNSGSTCTVSDDCPGGTCVPVDSWFDAPSSACTRTALDRRAKSNPAAFAWNPNAINVYVVNTCQGGYASRAPGQAIVIGQRKGGSFVRWLHEIGHFFSLCHTHGPGCPGCGNNGEDCLDDTFLDADEWDTPDEIAQGNGYIDYEDPTLTCDERQQILDVLYNIVSYHQDHQEHIVCDPSRHNVSCLEIPPPNLCRHRLTPDQLDLMADLSNTLRRNVSTACMVFVDSNAIPGDLLGVNACGVDVGFCNSGDVCCDLDGNGIIGELCAGPPPHPRPSLDGNSTRPYPTVLGALREAGAGDIVMIRGGSYNENIIIQDHVTLRASRGDAIIGASGL